MAETLSKLDIYVLKSALVTTEENEPIFDGFWEDGFKLDVLIHPYVFSSPEFIALGWPFGVFLNNGILKLILTQSLKEQTLRQLENSLHVSTSLYSVFLQIISKTPEIRFNFDFSEFSKPKNSDILRKILRTTLIIFPDYFTEDECEQFCQSFEYANFRKFSKITQEIIMGNPKFPKENGAKK